MKKMQFSVIFAAALVIFALVLGSCADLEEDGYGYVLAYDCELDMEMWLKILEDTANDGRYITLNLKNCTYVEDNKFGGLIKVEITDGTASEEYIALDAFPAIGWGKDRILAIILPDAVQMVNSGTRREDLDEEGEIIEIIEAAFRNFKNLRSVSGANVRHIGKYAFTDCESLREINFPRVGHTVTDTELADQNNDMSSGFRIDIGHFAFKGCTGLTSVTFNSAAVVGRSAFKGCTGLTKVNFPVAWMVAQSAFEGCKNLTEVRFESATKIGNEAFKDCIRLKKAYFDANPVKLSVSPIVASEPVYDSVIFYDAVFSGCSSLQLLDIRPAWNVFFCNNALEKTGKTIDVYLSDSSSGFGHPQLHNFLGDGENITLEEINFYASDTTKISTGSGIANFVESMYSGIDVNVNEISR